MTNIATATPASIFGDILTTTNNGAGLPASIPAQLQDGLGNPSPVYISQTTCNFLITPPFYFQLGGVTITASPQSINALCGQYPGLLGDGAFILPVGPNSGRPNPAFNGMTRYNTDINSLEIYINGAWRNA